MKKKREVLIFCGLIAALFVSRLIQYDSFGFTLGHSIGEIPFSIVLGRIILWFFDKLFIFFKNILIPDNPLKEIERTFWTTLNISLAIGFPIYVLVK